MVLSSYAYQRILEHYFAGHKAPSIEKKMRGDGIRVTRVGIWKFLKKYQSTGTIARREGGGRPSVLTPEVRLIVDQQMLKDDETTAYQVGFVDQIMLPMISCNSSYIRFSNKGIDISLSTILRCRTTLGWIYRGSAYCQLIRQVNKEKRLEWVREYLDECDDGFDNVIWTDESSIQCEAHKRHCYRKKGCAPKRNPRLDMGSSSVVQLFL